eukprot:TRINITY_DN393_c0_g1_i1.p2 TRINITY_DN393_c0_g1~~TRINITY_DN393_c0_g1_i1.p2  ORF type:complete len:497 (+),score=331.88 TRINITY_DN393_c0_g1_i1:141-1631(+)
MFALLVLALVASASAVAPAPWSTKLSVVIDDKAKASRAATTVMVPELQGDGLTITMTNFAEHDGAKYEACLKQDVASPVASGRAMWNKKGFCELFRFENTTATAFAKFGGAAGAAVAGASTVNVRAGTYFVTIAAVEALKKNVTAELTLSGTSCPKFGETGANCAPLPSLDANTPTELSAHGANALSAVYLADSGAITAETGAAVITVNHVAGDKSALVARWGALPTATLFDAKLDVKLNGTAKATIVAPRAARWYFGVLNGNSTLPTTVNVTVALTQCKAGSVGAACKTKVTAFGKPGAAAETAVKKGDVVYYKFHRNATAAMAALMAAPAASLAVAAAQYDADAANQTAPAIYARLGALASADDYDVAGCTVAHCAADQNTLMVPEADVSPALDDAEWYVAVVATADGTLAAWNAAGGACADDCSGNGECDAATATCTCADNFASFSCSVAVSKLERWEWALIIGGSVLVAIGLIGCIVFYIQKQQRRSGFERV